MLKKILTISSLIVLLGSSLSIDASSKKGKKSNAKQEAAQAGSTDTPSPRTPNQLLGDSAGIKDSLNSKADVFCNPAAIPSQSQTSGDSASTASISSDPAATVRTRNFIDALSNSSLITNANSSSSSSSSSDSITIATGTGSSLTESLNDASATSPSALLHRSATTRSDNFAPFSPEAFINSDIKKTDADQAADRPASFIKAQRAMSNTECRERMFLAHKINDVGTGSFELSTFLLSFLNNRIVSVGSLSNQAATIQTYAPHIYALCRAEADPSASAPATSFSSSQAYSAPVPTPLEATTSSALASSSASATATGDSLFRSSQALDVSAGGHTPTSAIVTTSTSTMTAAQTGRAQSPLVSRDSGSTMQFVRFDSSFKPVEVTAANFSIKDKSLSLSNTASSSAASDSATH